MYQQNKVYELNLHLYPRKVWVVVGMSVEEISRRFSTRNNNDVYLSDTAIATVISVNRRTDNRMGELIRISQVDYMTVGAIAHESLHAAMDICSDLGINPTYEEQEPLAYLVGYIAEFVGKIVKEVRK